MLTSPTFRRLRVLSVLNSGLLLSRQLVTISPKIFFQFPCKTCTFLWLSRRLCLSNPLPPGEYTIIYYQKAPTDSDEDMVELEDSVSSQQQLHKRRLKNRSLFAFAFTLSIIALLAATLMAFFRRKLEGVWNEPASYAFVVTAHEITANGKPGNTSTLDCGASRDEAIARGCIFDIMVDAWLPEPCYDAVAAALGESTGTFLAELGGSGQFEWFLDQNHTCPIAQEDL